MPRSRERVQSALEVSEKKAPLEEKTLIEEKLDQSLASAVLKDEGKKAVMALYLGLSPKNKHIVTPMLVEQHFAIYEESPLSYQRELATRIAAVQKEGHGWSERPSIALRRHLFQKAGELVEEFEGHYPVSVKTWEVGPSDFTKEGMVRDEFNDFVGLVRARRSKKGEIKSSLLMKAELTGGRKGRAAHAYLLFSGAGKKADGVREMVEDFRGSLKLLLREYGKAILGREEGDFIKALAREGDKTAARYEGRIEGAVVVSKPQRVVGALFGEAQLFSLNGGLKKVEEANPALGELASPRGRAVGRRSKVRVWRGRMESFLFANSPVKVSEEVVHYKDKVRALKKMLKGSRGARDNMDYSAAVAWLM